MDKSNKRALSMMRDIIINYLDGMCDKKDTVSNLFYSIDLNVIHCTNSVFMVTDCYYTIKHLTEAGYETPDYELAYFRDCIDGVREYNPDTKFEVLREYYQDGCAANKEGVK